jgi:hypothetical protein
MEILFETLANIIKPADSTLGINTDNDVKCILLNEMRSKINQKIKVKVVDSDAVLFALTEGMKYKSGDVGEVVYVNPNFLSES